MSTHEHIHGHMYKYISTNKIIVINILGIIVLTHKSCSNVVVMVSMVSVMVNINVVCWLLA